MHTTLAQPQEYSIIAKPLQQKRSRTRFAICSCNKKYVLEERGICPIAQQ